MMNTVCLLDSNDYDEHCLPSGILCCECCQSVCLRKLLPPFSGERCKLGGKTRYYRYRDRLIMHKSLSSESKIHNVKGEEQFSGPHQYMLPNI